MIFGKREIIMKTEAVDVGGGRRGIYAHGKTDIRFGIYDLKTRRKIPPPRADRVF